MLIKHEVKLSALLELRQHAKYYLRIARARPFFKCFKEVTHERLVKAFPFQTITQSINFFILGKTVLKDIVMKCTCKS